ncbi:MAG: hypothetical protein JZU55_03455 [Afipia sp.]|jgi:hypothetical protein|nr:hypothetical protein [Afipia sp.]
MVGPAVYKDADAFIESPMQIADAMFLATQLFLSARGAVRVTRCRMTKAIRSIRSSEGNP